MNQIFCVMTSTLGFECDPGQRLQRVSSADALHVVGHREQVEGAQRGRAGSRARRRSRRRGPARRGRRRRTRPRAGRRSTTCSTTVRLAPSRGGSSTTRSNGSSYADAQHPVDAARARPPRGRRRGCRARARQAAAVALDGDHAAGRSRRRRRGTRANSPTPAYRSSTGSPGCGASSSSTVSTSDARRAGVHLPEAVGGDREVVRPRDARRRDGRRPRRPCDQAVVDGDDVVRAVLAHARAARRAGATYRSRVRQRRPVLVAGHRPRPTTSQVEPGQPATAARAPRPP